MPFKRIVSRLGQALGRQETRSKPDRQPLLPESAEALFDAVARGDVATVAAGLDRGFDPRAELNGNPLLHVPICGAQGTESDREAVVELLIDRGADPEQADANGWTALLAACDKTDGVMIRLLLERGASATATDNKGWSAMHYLTYQQAALELFQMLVDAGAKIDHRSTADGNTSLMIAADRADAPRLRILLGLGANQSFARKDGLTALHMAANKGQVDISGWLLDAGANVDAIGGQMGCAPLHLAAAGGHRALVELLLERGADAVMVDNNGNTPVAVANGMGYFEIGALLQKHEERNL